MTMRKKAKSKSHARIHRLRKRCFYSTKRLLIEKNKNMHCIRQTLQRQRMIDDNADEEAKRSHGIMVTI
jgi:hypothetical protein